MQVGQHLEPERRRLTTCSTILTAASRQTTSSTLPLIAARAILPRIDFTRFSDGELRVDSAGLDRLATMRIESGGLAYWPGGSESNGLPWTVYAIPARCCSGARRASRRRRLLEGMKTYLADRLLGHDLEPDVQAAVAQSLTEARRAARGAADALQDRAEKQSVFGKASLAMALHGLAGQEDRVAALLDAIEASFDDRGELLVRPGHADFYYYGSPTRSKAQAAIALSRLRPAAKVLPVLLHALAEGTETYTTQATAYSLLRSRRTSRDRRRRRAVPGLARRRRARGEPGSRLREQGVPDPARLAPRQEGQARARERG